MPSDDLVRMANQIAQFFSPYPEADAVDGIREHLEKFWTPSMRKELVAICRGLIPAEHPLHPLVLQASQQLHCGTHE